MARVGGSKCLHLVLRLEGLIYEKMSRLRLVTVAVLVLVLLVACGDGDDGLSRAGVQETVGTEWSDSPTPPAVEPGLTSSRVVESIRSVAEVGDQQVSDSHERTPAKDRQLIPVRRDDLVTSISINGSIAFPNTRRVIFETRGTLRRLAVEEGQTVTAGQQLAYTDRATVIALEGAFAQAQVDASMARKALANTLTPHGSLEIAQAEAKVTNAKETLRTAEEKLLSLLRPTDHELATAESVRADSAFWTTEKARI